jgi:peptidoglycan/xylan/chitin deacetylase (PgdA/CDA1 family)
MIHYLKIAAKSSLCAAYKASGVPALQERRARNHGRCGMAILLFHRITDVVPPGGITVSTRHFRNICKMLQREFRVVPLGEVVRIVRSQELIPPRTVAITFDDSYKDNLYAAETLAEFHLPACFFIPSGYIATERVYEWDRQLPVRLPNLTWEDVREMADMGFEIGSHTVNHPNLALLSAEEVERELVNSRKTIEDKLGRPVRWFAYPYGDPEHLAPEQVKMVKEAGYEACFSAHHGFIYRHFTGAILPREPVPYFHSLLNLELYLAGNLHWMYNLKRRAGLQR